MSQIITEWFFDPIYDDRAKKWIHEGLDKVISEWIDVTYPRLQKHSVKYPTQRSGESIDGSTPDGKVWFLSVLLRDDRPPGAWHCLTHVGPEETILAKHRELKAHIGEQFRRPGGKGLLVERDFL